MISWLWLWCQRIVYLCTLNDTPSSLELSSSVTTTGLSCGNQMIGFLTGWLTGCLVTINPQSKQSHPALDKGAAESAEPKTTLLPQAGGSTEILRWGRTHLLPCDKSEASGDTLDSFTPASLSVKLSKKASYLWTVYTVLKSFCNYQKSSTSIFEQHWVIKTFKYLICLNFS